MLPDYLELNAGVLWLIKFINKQMITLMLFDQNINIPFTVLAFTPYLAINLFLSLAFFQILILTLISFKYS